MTSSWRVAGIVLILVGVALGIYAAFPIVAPEGSWSNQPGLAGRWWLALIGLALMIGGGILIHFGHRRAHDSPDTFLNGADEARVLAAIARFERRTSGEIRVHLARSAGKDILATARQVFERLGMTATKDQNGVLFFVAVASRQFAVIGDAGIDAAVPEDFWDEIVTHVRQRLTHGDTAGALTEGITLAGEALSQHFPVAPDDVNELPDEISREE